MAYILSQAGNSGKEDFITRGNATKMIVVESGTLIESIVLNPANADSINLGTTDGGGQYETARPLQAGQNNTLIIQTKFDVATVLYLTGLTGTTIGTIYKK